jgi:carbonic anhydrase/acetyltransferase-like protein (isoleucine patch superfamily)
VILEYRGKRPKIGVDVYIAPTAVIVGDVEIGDRSSIWFGTVIRGDMAPVRIGSETNVQDNCTVHTDQGFPAVIGSRVSVGHNAVVHGCTVEDESLVGIGALVLSGSVVGRGAVVAAGSVVREGQRIGPGLLVAGAPAKEKRSIDRKEADRFLQPVRNYLALAKDYTDIGKKE